MCLIYLYFLLFTCMNVSLHICLYIMCISGAIWGQQSLSDPRELGLQRAVGCHGVAGN